MPCDAITLVRLELKNANMDLLAKAVQVVVKSGAYIYPDKKRMSWSGGEYNRETGMIIVRNAGMGIEIRKAYSAEIVKDQAKKYGWGVKQTGAYQYEVTKR